MADLGDLYGALQTAVAAGGNHKVFFYAAGKNGAGLRHGFIAVVDALTCQLNFEQMDNEHALLEISQLTLIKVQALPMIGDNPATGRNPLLDIALVSAWLDPQTAPPPAALNTAISAIQHEPAPEALVIPLAPEDVAETHATTHAGPVGSARLKDDATLLLQTYYGNAAGLKVAAIATLYSPTAKPIEFLNACRQLAAILVGEPKAADVFRKLYDSLL
jgi:hypothetical protein